MPRDMNYLQWKVLTCIPATRGDQPCQDDNLPYHVSSNALVTAFYMGMISYGSSTAMPYHGNIRIAQHPSSPLHITSDLLQ